MFGKIPVFEKQERRQVLLMWLWWSEPHQVEGMNLERLVEHQSRFP